MLYALLMGIDLVDPACYPLDVPAVKSALLPVDGTGAIAALRDALGTFYGATIVALPVPARSDAVIAEFEALYQLLKPGDVLVCGYTGHGLFMYTTNAPAAQFANEGVGDLRVGRRWTTAILLADRLMLADEYNRLLGGFGPGIDVVNIVDACASGTFLSEAIDMSKNLLQYEQSGNSPTLDGNENPTLVNAIYDVNRELYDRVLARGPGALRVAGVQFASAAATQVGLASAIDAPFSRHIAEAIRYNLVASYQKLDEIVTNYAGTLYKPIMYPFGEATTTFTAKPLFDPVSRIQPPLPDPGA